MSFYVKKALFVTLIFVLFFALIFSFTTNRTKKEIQKVKKVDDTSVASDTANTTSCYRLANILIKYFNKSK